MIAAKAIAMKSFIRTRLPVILLLLLAGVAGAACMQTPASRPQVGTAQPLAAQTAVVPRSVEAGVALVTAIPTLAAEWKVYTDPAAGYSLSYPPGVHFSAGMSKAGIYTVRIQFRISGVEGYQGMLIRVEPNPEGAGVEQAAEAIYQRFVGEKPSPELLAGLEGATVDGLPGVRMGEGGDFAIVVPYAGRVYVVAPVHDQVANAVDPQALALFYSVLSTLKVQR